MASGFDSTISILIARDVLTNIGIDDSVLMGMPVMFSSAGILIGSTISSILNQRVPGKRLAYIMLSASIVVCGISFFAVENNMF